MSEVLFELNNNSLQSATSFVQYIVNISRVVESPRFRLITLIGERHNFEFSCSKPSITIEEYVKKYLKRDSKTMVLLEMDKNQYDKSEYPNSVPIRAILENKEYHRHLKYYDPRNDFLGNGSRYALYNSKLDLLVDKSRDEIIELYTKPFYEKWSLLSKAELKKHSYNYNREQLKFLTKDLYKEIYRSFEDVKKYSSNYIHKLRICW